MKGSMGCKSTLSLFVLVLVSILNQADRWVFPALAPAGLRCHVPPPGSCNSSSGNHSFPASAATGEQFSNDELASTAAQSDPTSPATMTTVGESNATNPCASTGCIPFNSYDQGILTGPAFAAVYVLSGVPLSRLADTSSRLVVLALGLCLWSGMVLSTGFVHTTWQLYLTRLGLGVGEATCSPVAYAMLADLFDVRHRSLAISIYSAGTYIGASIGNLCGVLSDVLCWRWTFKILGLAGFGVLPLMACTLYSSEKSMKSSAAAAGQGAARAGQHSINDAPVPDSTHDAEQETLKSKTSHLTIKETVVQLLSCHPYLIICTAASIRVVGGYALGAWCATFYREHYGETPANYGMKLFIVFMAGGLPGAILGGFFADRFATYGPQWKAYIIALTQVIAAPLVAGMLVMPSANLSYVLLTVSFLFSEAWMGVAASIVQDVHQASIRCQASALYIALSTLVGCVGPVLISAILANQDACDKNYKLALMYVVPTAYLASALLFLLTGVVTHYQEIRRVCATATAMPLPGSSVQFSGSVQENSSGFDDRSGRRDERQHLLGSEDVDDFIS